MAEETSTGVPLSEALSFISATASDYGVDSNHAQSILLAENMGPTGEVPDVLSISKTSPRGAAGLMQVMPETRKALIEQGFLDPVHTTDRDWQSNIHAGLAALREIQARRKTRDPRVIAAEYNAGPRGGQMVSEGNFDALPSETIDYLKRVDLAQAKLAGFSGTTSPGTRISDLRAPRRGVTVTQVQGMEAINQLLRDNAIFVDQAVSAVTRSTEAEAAASKAAGEAAVTAGQEVGRAEQLRAMIEAAGVQSRERILGILELDTRKTENIIAEKTAEFHSLEPQRQALDVSIDEREAVGFFDNPLQYLINQTMLPGVLAKRNAMARKQNEAFSIMSSLQGVAETQQRIDIAASADRIAQLGVHLGNARVAEANAKAAGFKAAAASATARGVTTIANLYERRLDNEIKVAQLSRVVQTYREGDVAKTEEKADQDKLDADLKRLGALMGVPNMSLQVMKRMSKKEQQEWLDRVAANNIGNDLYEAITFLKPGWIANMEKTGSAGLAQFLRTVQSGVFAAARAKSAALQMSGAKVPRDEELLQEAARSIATEFFGSRHDLMAVTPNSQINPYRANHSAMATSWKGSPDNVVFKIVRDGVEKKLRYNDQMLFTAVSKMVEANTLSPKQAAQDIADYYTAAVDRNNSTFSFNLVGMGPQTDYRVLPKESTKIANLLSPVEVENLFTLAVARRMGIGAGFIVPEGFETIPGAGGAIAPIQ